MLLSCCNSIWIFIIEYSVREETHQITGLGSVLGKFQGSIMKQKTSRSATTVVKRCLRRIIGTPENGSYKTNPKQRSSSDLLLLLLLLPVHDLPAPPQERNRDTLQEWSNARWQQRAVVALQSNTKHSTVCLCLKPFTLNVTHKTQDYMYACHTTYHEEQLVAQIHSDPINCHLFFVIIRHAT